MRACLTLLALCLVFAMTGCSKSDTVQAPTSPPPPTTPGPGQKSTNGIDVCSLLTSSEIQAIQGGPLKDTKGSTNPQGGLNISQCYFLLPTAADSIVVTVTQKADGSNSRDPKESWDEIFRRDRDKDKEEASKEEEGKSEPPERIDGLGDEAFWAPRRFGGALYAIKGNIYISVSVGGAGDKASRIQKSKALAEIVLKRL
jgi:hypothetical protein